MAKSRTGKSIQNVRIALLYYVLNLILQFFSRKIFLDYLGSEVLGLNTTAQNLLGFLNLAELGIGGAVAYNLYRPLYENDRKTINEIVSIQGWLYRRIAVIMLVGAGILMFFFPFIFAKAEIPLWYAYGSFIVLLVSALLGYFVNYHQIVLSADQKEYKITLSVQSVKLFKVVLQLFAICYLGNGYVWWMILELLMAFVSSFVLNKNIKKEYPWLKPVPSEGGRLRSKYPTILTKTKQVFFHKIGGFVLTQTSPLVIYAYASLTLVAIYGNYMLIITGVTMLVGALLNSIAAGVGNLVAEGNKKRIKEVFWELAVLKVWMASVFCFGIYMLGDSFITLWVGKEYILPESAFVVLIGITFLTLSRTCDIFLGAYGLYQDIWSPIIEATLNLGLSILLGYYYGLTGILSGVFISLLLVIFCWKPYFLFTRGFKDSVWEYVLRYAKILFLLAVSFEGSMWIVQQYIHLDSESYLEWCTNGVLVSLVYICISLGLLCLMDVAMRNLFRRFLKVQCFIF